MTFYLIGLGLSLNSISVEALEVLKKCKKIYLENYTVDFPYPVKKLEKIIGKKIKVLKREEIESEEIVKEAKKRNIALIVYGSPLSATTHISLILNCKKQKIPYKIFHNASIFTAVSETGLQLYKFGKTASMPSWQKNYKPDSFMEIVKANQKIKAHTLLLIDIGLSSRHALDQLQKASKKRKVKLDKIIICSQLGTKKQKIHYKKIEKLKNQKIILPFCIIIPSKMHFIEQEALNLQ